jgi:hypothetical protein
MSEVKFDLSVMTPPSQRARTPGYTSTPPNLGSAPSAPTTGSTPAAQGDESGSPPRGKSVSMTGFGKGKTGPHSPGMPAPQAKGAFKSDYNDAPATELLKQGGAPMVQSAPDPQSGGDYTSIAQKTGSSATFSDQGTGFVASKPADQGPDWLQGGGCVKQDANTSATQPAKTGGFPDASGGDGKGRQPQTVIGTTKAKARTPVNMALYGKRK